MAKTDTRSVRPRSPAPRHRAAAPGAGPRVARLIVGLLLASTIAAAATLGFGRLRTYVEKDLVFPNVPPTVVLKNRPAWMTDFLAEQIIKAVRPVGAHSAFDHQMLVDTTALLQSNPWVRKVNQVRRVYGHAPGDTLEIDCDFRAPVALVKWRDYYCLVDGDAYKLPEQYAVNQLDRIMIGLDGKMSIRVIEGVGHAPVATGVAWPGDDLSGGIAMVKLLYDQPYAEQIWSINVANYKGRRDPRAAQITLLTRQNTQILWGRAPGDVDYFIEVPVARKLQWMKSAFEKYGRVDAGEAWIDVRFDQPVSPSSPAQPSAPTAGTSNELRTLTR